MFMYAIAGEPGTYHLKRQADEALIAKLRKKNERLTAILQNIATNLDGEPSQLNISQMEFKLKIIKALATAALEPQP